MTKKKESWKRPACDFIIPLITTNKVVKNEKTEIKATKKPTLMVGFYWLFVLVIGLCQPIVNVLPIGWVFDPTQHCWAVTDWQICQPL